MLRRVAPVAPGQHRPRPGSGRHLGYNSRVGRPGVGRPSNTGASHEHRQLGQQRRDPRRWPARRCPARSSTRWPQFGDRVALRWRDGEAGALTFDEYADRVARVAAGLRELGVRPGRPRRADDAQHPRVPRRSTWRSPSAGPRRCRSTTRRRPTRSPTWLATAGPRWPWWRTTGSSRASSRCATAHRRCSTWWRWASPAPRRPTRSCGSTSCSTTSRSTWPRLAAGVATRRPGHASSTPRARPVHPRA